MSGAAGLSAARRRRAGGSETPTTNEKIQQGQPDKRVPGQKHGVANQITPFHILKSHENRLNVINDLVTELGTKVESDLKSNNNGVYHNLQTKMSDLETELRNMKGLIQQIQTFTMEMNVSLLKLQQKIVVLEERNVSTQSQ